MLNIKMILIPFLISLTVLDTSAKVRLVNVSNLVELENRTESEEKRIVLGLLLPSYINDIDIVSQYSSLDKVLPAVILAATELEQWDWEILVSPQLLRVADSKSPR